MNSPITWYGGKHHMVKHLLPLIPRHTCYAEVFGGAMNVLLSKPESKVEYYNDLNSDVVNFFRVLRPVVCIETPNRTAQNRMRLDKL